MNSSGNDSGFRGHLTIVQDNLFIRNMPEAFCHFTTTLRAEGKVMGKCKCEKCVNSPMQSVVMLSSRSDGQAMLYLP